MPFLRSRKVLILIILFSLIVLSSFKFIKEGEVIGFHHPESAYLYNNYIYVSNIGSSPISKDKDGFITKLDKYGNILEFKFITGLEAPKGIYAYKNKLYIADLTRLCIADLKTTKLKCIDIKGSKFLNDLVVLNSTVYITDTLKDCVFRIKNNKITVFFKENNLSPNGIVFSKKLNSLLVVSFNKPVINQINLDGKLIKSFYLNGLTGFDGITIGKRGEILISDYRTGKIIKTVYPFKKYEIVKDLNTPISDIFASGNRILLPLIDKNKLILGTLR